MVSESNGDTARQISAARQDSDPEFLSVCSDLEAVIARLDGLGLTLAAAHVSLGLDTVLQIQLAKSKGS